MPISPRLYAPLLALAATLTLAACDCAGPTPVTRCSNDDECEDNETCFDGMCRARTDAGDPGEVDGGPVEGCVDEDGDGHFGMTDDCPEGDDCDDTDRARNPGVAETCNNGIDEDCDGTTDEPDCDCRAGERVVCYSGASETTRVGQCRSGVALCVEAGMIGDCQGEVLPGEETCDGTDEDCDGMVDETLRNACGECAAERAEMCGNEADDDCDGQTDEGCDCDYRCNCEVGTSCECEPPTNQPCYEGPFGTGGQGVCQGGRRDCIEDAVSGSNRWAMCNGQVLPGEECAGGVADGDDDDCDGIVDEGCRDADGDGSAFPNDCDDTDPDVNPGAPEVCNGRDDNCNGVPDEGVTNGCGGCGDVAAAEVCGNGQDDDCNGMVDDGCQCTVGETQDCFGGPEGTSGIGACMGGSQTCEGSNEFPAWGACGGQVIPGPEVCSGVDDDCDGAVDERWAAGSNACGWCDPTEVCDGEDQDCDGLVDEGVSNACGECGPEPVETCDSADNDCDGAVDEGVVNACGTCPPEPCFTEGWPTPGDCTVDGRDCDDVEEHPDHPGSVTLGQSTLDFDYLYLAVTSRNQLAQMDTAPGPTRGNKNWQVDSLGCNPSRTAVAGDGSVWVTNRGHNGCNSGSECDSNVMHFSADGTPICRAPVLNVARSVAIDGNGDIWAGSHSGGDLYHISGTDLDGMAPACPRDPFPIPRCRVINTIDTNVSIYGLTADPDGFMWTASSPNSVRVNTSDYSMTTVANPTFYGIAPDGNGYIWMGGHGGDGPVHRISRTSPFTVEDVIPPAGQSNLRITGVTVHPNGNIYGSSHESHMIVGYDGVTRQELCRAGLPANSGSAPHGIAVDRSGLIWMPSRNGGYVTLWDTNCANLAVYPVDLGQEIYSYSDMTGHLLRTFISPEGNWQQIFDSGYAIPYWTQIVWNSIEPVDTDIEFYAVTADDIPGLATGVSCGPFNTSPADLSTCPAGFQDHRYMQVSARLFRTGSTDERPILLDVNASWAY